MLEDFYTTTPPVEESAGRFVCTVTLNAAHKIFEGHFPDNPVTPGVCMMHIVKALSEQIVGEKLFLSSANNVKFMSIINPNLTPHVDMVIELSQQENEGIKVKATALVHETVALKMSLQYKVLS